MQKLQATITDSSIFYCHQCGCDDSGGGIGGWSVHTVLWKQYGNGKGILCMKCFEKRLGRKLLPDDFTDTLDNETNSNVQAILKE